ncbi:hypothetical protein ACIBO6_22035 [Streptomyces luteogriseus]|uniref:hypothetical protein n=1 Tax=Streptomyces luteogriseus TaxID=68233 RepID=UPI0037ACBD16
MEVDAFSCGYAVSVMVARERTAGSDSAAAPLADGVQASAMPVPSFSQKPGSSGAMSVALLSSFGEGSSTQRVTNVEMPSRTSHDRVGSDGSSSGKIAASEGVAALTLSASDGNRRNDV